MTRENLQVLNPRNAEAFEEWEDKYEEENELHQNKIEKTIKAMGKPYQSHPTGWHQKTSLPWGKSLKDENRQQDY